MLTPNVLFLLHAEFVEVQVVAWFEDCGFEVVGAEREREEREREERAREEKEGCNWGEDLCLSSKLYDCCFEEKFYKHII